MLQEYNPQGIHQAIRLPGQHHDRETGLYYNRHRYYDPVVGSYVNQDPIGLEGGSNQYAYSLNSPLEISDPTGLIPPLLIIGVMALVGGVVGAGTNVAKQKIINKNCKIDWGETINSVAWSALGGAAMPLIGTTALGAAAIGGTTGLGQYITGSRIGDGYSLTASGTMLNTGMGVIGGSIGGSFVNKIPKIPPAPFINPYSETALPNVLLEQSIKNTLQANGSIGTLGQATLGSAVGGTTEIPCLTCEMKCE